MAWVFGAYIATVFLSAACQAVAMTKDHTDKEFAIAAALAMIPVVNVMVAGFALGGFVKKLMK